MSNAGPERPIPVLRPRLPSAEALLPWLRRIDSCRIYSNFGPLCTEFAARLGDHFGVGAGAILPVANATQGLTAALLALGARPGTLCAMPAFTFVATAHAAIAAGLVPWLLDIDAERWDLDPATLDRVLDLAPGEVGAAIPVCPFGRPIDGADWAEFSRRTGIAVVIDAAAGFDALTVGPVPAVVSLHATKAMGIGEGGFIACSDHQVMQDAMRRVNFGFFGSREALGVATNAKMSEYHAAVGLAALEEWPAARAAFASVQTGLRRRVEPMGIAWPAGLGSEWVPSTISVALPVPAVNAAVRLAEDGIESRQWWGGGLHRHPAFATCPRTALPVTDAVARSVLGLPCWRGLDEAALDAIGRSLAGAVGGSP